MGLALTGAGGGEAGAGVWPGGSVVGEGGGRQRPKSSSVEPLAGG